VDDKSNEIPAVREAAQGIRHPVIDGLDEMDTTPYPEYASRAGAAIRACNAYLAGSQKTACRDSVRFVLATRTASARM
jgi:hypothetical protein